MSRLTLATAIFLLPTTTFADTQLERFEAIADDLNTVMIDMFVNEIEQAGGDATALRDLDGMTAPWSDEMREAAGCILDAYIEDTSSGAVDDAFDRMEEIMPTLSSMTITEATDTEVLDAMQPEGLSDDRMMEINSDCGMMELQIEAGKESGFRDAMIAAGSTMPDSN